MQEFKDSTQYKNYIGKLLTGLDINKDSYERMFAKVFADIFEKEKLFPCILLLFQTSVSKRIVRELKNIKKQDRTLFLPLFEDYQKLNNELSEVISRIKKECGEIFKNCKDLAKCKIDFSKYPVLSRITERDELIAFKPDLVTSPAFLEFFEKNIDKFGLYFLFNLKKELMFVGKSLNLGEKIIDSIWEKSIDGYVAVAYTRTKSDIHVYEPYYILKEKPLLNTEILEPDEITVELKPLKKSELVKIYENN
jgi:hypothetical protein